MNQLKALRTGLRILLASLLAGTMFQSGCIDQLASVGGKLARNVNPCGTIIACDPIEWDLMFHSYPDYQRDPTCVIPGLCGTSWPPSSTGVGTTNTTTGTGTTGTGTTGTGTTTTGTGTTGTTSGLFGGSTGSVFGGF